MSWMYTAVVTKKDGTEIYDSGIAYGLTSADGMVDALDELKVKYPNAKDHEITDIKNWKP